MEHDNTEEFIKEIIGNREIEPSDQARERLIHALNTKPKTRKLVWWHYAIAASVVLVMCFMGAKLMVEDVNSSYPNTEIVNEDQNPSTPSKSIVPKDPIEVVSSDATNDTLSSKNPESLPKLKTKVVSVAIETKVDDLQSNPQDIESIDLKTPSLETKIATQTQIDSVMPVVPNQFMYVSPEALLASTITDSTVKLQQHLKKPSENYVDSETLLLEIERQRFDEKNKSIFNKASKELKKAKEALANRNYKNNN